MSSTDHAMGNTYCLFQSGGVWFALPAHQVREVTARPTTVSVPRSHVVLAGLCHEGSEFLPVLRIPSRTSNGTVLSNHERQMLVLQGPQGVWGLLIDQIHGIENLECSYEAEGYYDEWSTAVMGTAKFRDQVVRILHTDGLYRLAEQLLHRSWHELTLNLAAAS